MFSSREPRDLVPRLSFVSFGRKFRSMVRGIMGLAVLTASVPPSGHAAIGPSQREMYASYETSALSLAAFSQGNALAGRPEIATVYREVATPVTARRESSLRRRVALRHFDASPTQKKVIERVVNDLLDLDEGRVGGERRWSPAERAYFVDRVGYLKTREKRVSTYLLTAAALAVTTFWILAKKPRLSRREFARLAGVFVATLILDMVIMTGSALLSPLTPVPPTRLLSGDTFLDETVGDEIRLNWDYFDRFEKHPELLEFTVSHAFTHALQHHDRFPGHNFLGDAMAVMASLRRHNGSIEKLIKATEAQDHMGADLLQALRVGVASASLFPSEPERISALKRWAEKRAGNTLNLNAPFDAGDGHWVRANRLFGVALLGQALVENKGDFAVVYDYLYLWGVHRDIGGVRQAFDQRLRDRNLAPNLSILKPLQADTDKARSLGLIDLGDNAHSPSQPNRLPRMRPMSAVVAASA